MPLIGCPLNKMMIERIIGALFFDIDNILTQRTKNNYLRCSRENLLRCHDYLVKRRIAADEKQTIDMGEDAKVIYTAVCAILSHSEKEKKRAARLADRSIALSLMRK